MDKLLDKIFFSLMCDIKFSDKTASGITEQIHAYLLGYEVL